MPRDSLGNYSLPAGNPVITGTVIASDWANDTMSDVGAELANSLDRQGRGGMQGPLRITDGTLTAPGLAFVSETRSGILRETLNQWALVADGATVLRIIKDNGSGGGGVFVAGGRLDTATGVFLYEQGNRVYSDANPPPGAGTTFLSLNDTPVSYVGFDGQVPVVDEANNRLIFGSTGTGSGDFTGPNGATPNAVVLFDDASGKVGKDSTVDFGAVIRADVQNQRVLSDFIITKDAADAVGSLVLERAIGDSALRLDVQESNALRGHILAVSGTSAPGGRALFLQESAQRGVVIGEDQVTPAGTYADAGKDTLRVMGPLYESRTTDSVNHRVHSDLYYPAYPTTNVGKPGSHNVTLPDTSFAFQQRGMDQTDFAVDQDTFELAENGVTNVKLSDMGAGTIKMSPTALGDPQDVRVDALGVRATLLDADAVIVQGAAGSLEQTTVADLGKLDTPAYVGTGDARLDMTPSGGDRPLKRILQGTNMEVLEDADTITLNATLSGTGAGIQKGAPFVLGDLMVVSSETGDGGANTTNLQAAQVPQLDTAETWTASPQTFAAPASDGGVDITASQTPRVRLKSTSGVADKNDGRVIMTQNGHLDLAAYDDAGSPVAVAAEFWMNGGVVLPPATGGDQGAGSINAASFWENGVPLRTAIGDTFVTGPGSSTNQAIAVYDDTTGQVLANGVTTIAQLAPAAAGMPTLGTAGQFLIKNSTTNYDASWQDPAVRRTYGDYPYQFSTSLNTGIDPGSGTIALNSATASLVTQLAISATDFDLLTPGPDVLAAMNVGDMIFFRSEVEVQGGCYRVTGLTDNTSWIQLDVAFVAVASQGLPDAFDRCAVSVELLPQGGGGSGDVTSAANTVEGEVQIGDGSFPKGIKTAGFQSSVIARTDAVNTFVTGQIVDGASFTASYLSLAGTRTWGWAGTATEGFVGPTDGAGNFSPVALRFGLAGGVSVGTPIVITPDGPGRFTASDYVVAEGQGVFEVINSAARRVMSGGRSDTIAEAVGFAGTARTVATPFTGAFEPTAGQYVDVTGTGLLTTAAQTENGIVKLAIPDAVSVVATGYTEVGTKPTGRASILQLERVGSTLLAVWA